MITAMLSILADYSIMQGMIVDIAQARWHFDGNPVWEFSNTNYTGMLYVVNK